MPIDSWKTHILNPDAPVDATTLQETADCILRLFAIHLAHTVNFIELIDVPVNGEHLAMALRCTSSRKKWITGWYGALSQAKSALAREGKGADGALFGLEERPPAPVKSPSDRPMASARYFWKFSCIQNGAVVAEVVFSTRQSQRPSLPETFQQLLALHKVPMQRRPPMLHQIDAIGWSTAIPHLSGL